MVVDPIRYIRRRRRLLQEAEEEAAYLRRRFGPDAHRAALEKLQRPDLTTWGKRVVQEAAKRLEQA